MLSPALAYGAQPGAHEAEVQPVLQPSGSDFQPSSWSGLVGKSPLGPAAAYDRSMHNSFNRFADQSHRKRVLRRSFPMGRLKAALGQRVQRAGLMENPFGTRSQRAQGGQGAGLKLGYGLEKTNSKSNLKLHLPAKLQAKSIANGKGRPQAKSAAKPLVSAWAPQASQPSLATPLRLVALSHPKGLGLVVGSWSSNGVNFKEDGENTVLLRGSGCSQIPDSARGQGRQMAQKPENADDSVRFGGGRGPTAWTKEIQSLARVWIYYPGLSLYSTQQPARSQHDFRTSRPENHPNGHKLFSTQIRWEQQQWGYRCSWFGSSQASTGARPCSFRARRKVTPAAHVLIVHSPTQPDVRPDKYHFIFISQMTTAGFENQAKEGLFRLYIRRKPLGSPQVQPKRPPLGLKLTHQPLSPFV